MSTCIFCRISLLTFSLKSWRPTWLWSSRGFVNSSHCVEEAAGRQERASNTRQTPTDMMQSQTTDRGCKKAIDFFFKKGRGNNATTPLLQESCSVSYQTGRGIHIEVGGGGGRDVGCESAGRSQVGGRQHICVVRQSSKGGKCCACGGSLCHWTNLRESLSVSIGFGCKVGRILIERYCHSELQLNVCACWFFFSWVINDSPCVPFYCCRGWGESEDEDTTLSCIMERSGSLRQMYRSPIYIILA